MEDFIREIQIGKYTIKLHHLQIKVLIGRELVKVIDIKNPNDEKTEFMAYVNKFQSAYNLKISGK